MRALQALAHRLATPTERDRKENHEQETAMGFRVMPDGSIETDTVAEAVELSRMLAKGRVDEEAAIDTELAVDPAPSAPATPFVPSPTAPGSPSHAAWDPPSGTWYFYCHCGRIQRGNEGISHAIEGAECSRCHVRADRPKPDPCHLCKKSMRGLQSRWLDDGHEAHVNCHDVRAAPIRANHPALQALQATAEPTRFADIDGLRHVTGTDCCLEERCAICRSRLHTTLGSLGTSILCEGCHAEAWSVPEPIGADPSAEPHSPEWWAAFHTQHGRDPSPAEMSRAARDAGHPR